MVLLRVLEVFGRKVIFDINVSKSTSTVCELIKDSKSITTLTNDRPGFLELLKDLKTLT